MNNIIALFQYTIQKKNVKLFIFIFLTVFVVITYTGRVIINEFEKLKDNFLEDLSTSINKKIQIGPLKGDYLYNLSIKDVTIMNRNDNTVYANIPSIDIEYNILRILLDSKNGLNHVKSVTIKDFQIYLREGLFQDFTNNVQNRVQSPENETESPLRKIQLMKIKLVNGRISRTLWGGRKIVIDKVYGTFSKTRNQITAKISGKLTFYNNTEKLYADISILAYKTDDDVFTAGLIRLKNVRYGIFYLKEAQIGITVGKNNIKFTTLKRSSSSILLEKIYSSVFEPNIKYDNLPAFSGNYNFVNKTLSAKLQLHSEPYTVNRVYKYFIGKNINGLFKWGFYPHGEAELKLDLKKKKIFYKANMTIPNMLKIKDRIHLSLTGNSKEINLNLINYKSPEGVISGNGIFNFNNTIPEVNLYVDNYKIPIASGIELSTFIRTKQTSPNEFDIIFEDIDTVTYYKKYLKFSFTLQNNATIIKSDTIINKKLKAEVIIPKHGAIKAKIDFLDISLDAIKNAVNPKYYSETPVDNTDRENFIVNGSIEAVIDAGSMPVVSGNVKILNDEIREKYLLDTIFTFKDKTITFEKLNASNGKLILKGEVAFDGNYIFPVLKGQYNFWKIHLAARIIRGPVLKFEGLLNHSLNFHGSIKNGIIKTHFDLDDFILTLARKPIMLSDSFTLIYNTKNKTLTGGGIVIWHNIEIFEGKKTGIYVRFTQKNNVLTGHEVIFMADFSSKRPINLEAGNYGFGKVWIDTEYSDVRIKAFELNKTWNVYFCYGMTSDILTVLVSFIKPYDFTKVDRNFYKKFIPGVSRGKIVKGYVQTVGTSADPNITSQIEVKNGLWNGINFNGIANFSLKDNILTMKKINIFNNKGIVKVRNLIIAMNDTWQIDFDAKINITFLNNDINGDLVLRSSNREHNHIVNFIGNNLSINNKSVSNVDLGIISKQMRFFDYERENWSVKIFSKNSDKLSGYIKRSNGLINLNFNYFINSTESISMEGTVKDKKLNLNLYSSPLNLNYLNYLSTGLYNITGKTRFSFNVKGTLKDPEFFGYLKIIEGGFKINNIVNPFSNLKAYLDFNDRKINIKYFEVENNQELLTLNGFAIFENWNKPDLAINLKTTKDKGLEVDFTQDILTLRGKVKLNLLLQGEEGKNILKGKISLLNSLILVSPININLNRSSDDEIQISSTRKKSFFNKLGLDLSLVINKGVDFRLNPEILEMRLLEKSKLSIKKEAGLNKDINITGFIESRKGILKAYNSIFNIFYAKIEFKNETVVLGRSTKVKNTIYLTLNSRTSIRDERDERIDVYLDYNGEVNSDTLKNFNKHLVLKIPSNRPKREVMAILGNSGEGLSLLLSPILNVFRDQLGFIDRIEGRTEAFENLSKRKKNKDNLMQSGYQKLNPLHNTEIKIGKYINLFGLFNNNFYLKYSYIFKQEPYSKVITGYHKIGFDWTIYTFNWGNILLNFNYSPIEMEDSYQYQPMGNLIMNIMF